jgi:hypothetical protein
VGLSLAILLLPPLLDLLIHGWKRVFSYFAGDTFYYLTVARNVVHHGFFSFDQERITNGFHPLWQYITALLYQLTAALDLPEAVFLVAVLLTGLALLGAALLALASSFRLAWGRVPAAFPLLPAGLYALTMWSIEPHYGSLWSFANGMESSLTIAAFAWVLRCLVRREANPTVAASFQLGVALSVLTLSRLDHGLLAPVVLGWAWLRSVPFDTPRLLGLLALTLPFAAVLAVYVSFNLLQAGSLLPVSGALKSTFPHWTDQNVRHLVNLFRDPGSGPGMWRQTQLFLPSIVAALSLPWLLSRRLRGEGDLLTGPLITGAVFVLGLASYDFLFVNLWHHGHWYFPASVLLMSVLFLYLAEGLRPLPVAAPAAVATGASAMLAAVFFAAGYYDAGYNSQYRKTFDTREEIAARFGSEPPKIIEYDDGIIAFTTGFQAISGLGFTLDHEAVAWKQRRRLLWLAYDRGFDHIASMNYFGTGGLSTDSDSEEIRRKLAGTFFLTPSEVAPFDFEVVHVTSGREFAIIRMRPRDGAWGSKHAVRSPYEVARQAPLPGRGQSQRVGVDTARSLPGWRQSRNGEFRSPHRSRHSRSKITEGSTSSTSKPTPRRRSIKSSP